MEEKKKKGKTFTEMNEEEFIAKLAGFVSNQKEAKQKEITQLFESLSTEFVRKVCLKKVEHAELVIQCFDKANLLPMLKKIGEEAATKWPTLRKLVCGKISRLSLETSRTWLEDGKGGPEVFINLLSNFVFKKKSAGHWMTAFSQLTFLEDKKTVVNKFLGEGVDPEKSKRFMQKIYESTPSTPLSGLNALMAIGRLDPKYAAKVDERYKEHLKSCAFKTEISVDTWMTVLNWLQPNTQETVINEFFGKEVKLEKSIQFVAKIYQSDPHNGINALKTICNLNEQCADKVNTACIENLQSCALKPKLSVDAWITFFNSLHPDSQKMVVNGIFEKVAKSKESNKFEFITKIYQSGPHTGINVFKTICEEPKYAAEVAMMCSDSLKTGRLENSGDIKRVTDIGLRSSSYRHSSETKGVRKRQDFRQSSDSAKMFPPLSELKSNNKRANSSSASLSSNPSSFLSPPKKPENKPKSGSIPKGGVKVANEVIAYDKKKNKLGSVEQVDIHIAPLIEIYDAKEKLIGYVPLSAIKPLEQDGPRPKDKP